MLQLLKTQAKFISCLPLTKVNWGSHSISNIFDLEAEPAALIGVTSHFANNVTATTTTMTTWLLG